MIKYYLLVTANPLSDSYDSITLFKIIKRLDILSRDTKIFLPGFHAAKSKEKETDDEVNANIKKIKSYNTQDNNRDYHGTNPIYHTYIESHGDIYFNDVDFSKFMLDFEDECPKFEYNGCTQLVVLPTESGKLLSDEIASYNLNVFNSSQHQNEIEQFLLSVIKLIRKDVDKNSLKLLPKINDTYRKLNHVLGDKETASVIIHLDKSLLNYMKWKEQDEIFFISYSTKDEFDAYAFKALLEKQGKNVWMAPEGIPAGLDYACVIPAALRITTRFVVLLSHNSAKSEWVRKEIGKAITYNKRIDGIFLDDFNFENVKQYDHLDFMLENVQLKYNIRDLFNNKDLFKDFLEKYVNI